MGNYFALDLIFMVKFSIKENSTLSKLVNFMQISGKGEGFAMNIWVKELIQRHDIYTSSSLIIKLPDCQILSTLTLPFEIYRQFKKGHYYY